jgi:hypothetical protein
MTQFNSYVNEKLVEYDRRERMAEAERERTARSFLSWLKSAREQAAADWTHMRTPEAHVSPN